jgi:hypothetical protein
MRAVHLSVLAASLACLCAGNASAANSAKAEVSNLSIKLIDLDPLDGITPSLTFGGQVSANYRSSFSDGVYKPFTEAYSASYSLGGRSASILGGPSGGGTYHFAVTASAETAQGASAELRTDFQPYSGEFEISANTLLLITGHALIDLTRNSHWRGDDAGASLRLSLVGNDNGTGGTSRAEVRLWKDFYNNYWDTAFHAEKAIDLSYANLGAVSQKIGLSLSLEASAWGGPGSTPAVPEPQTYALLACGLGTLVAVRRRRPPSGQ